MKKNVMLILLGIILVIPMVVFAAFPDVAETHWAAGYINELTDKGVINGYNDGTFKPENTLTRGEFLKLIITASLPEIDYTKVRTDFEHWAASYVKVAENYNVIVDGFIDIHNIDESITRLEMIQILSLADIEIRGTEQKSVYILNFKDIGELSNSEIILLKHAVASEIIGGYPDGTFKPNNNLTRAEASKILSVYINKGGK